MPYLVKMLNTTVDVMLPSGPVEVPLIYAEGMIGTLPVFETREQAELLAGGVFEIAEVSTMPANTLS